MQSGGGDRLPVMEDAEGPLESPATLESTRQEILDALAECDGHDLPADIRKELSWMKRRAARLGT
jgi:hypothetical protein